MIAKNYVVKIQNLNVNHKSRPDKSNPGEIHFPLITDEYILNK